MHSISRKQFLAQGSGAAPLKDPRRLLATAGDIACPTKSTPPELMAFQAPGEDVAHLPLSSSTPGLLNPRMVQLGRDLSGSPGLSSLLRARGTGLCPDGSGTSPVRDTAGMHPPHLSRCFQIRKRGFSLTPDCHGKAPEPSALPSLALAQWQHRGTAWALEMFPKICGCFYWQQANLSHLDH